MFHIKASKTAHGCYEIIFFLDRTGQMANLNNIHSSQQMAWKKSKKVSH